ncbi:hypothetical protein JXO52_00825 [bacterium]|nr:hypothetical protein [bacterium]
MSAVPQKRTAAALLLLLWAAAGAQYVRFPGDSSRFVPAGADSLFIFSRDLAVAAQGAGLDRIRYADGSIRGDGLPKTLYLAEPVGAILYQRGIALPEIPSIRSRLDGVESFAPLFRNGALGFTRYRGRSGRNGIDIDVWEPREGGGRSLLFFPDGIVLDAETWATGPDAPGLDDLSGIWIDPPEYGVHDIPALVVRTLSRRHCLVVYIDGLGWDALEQSLLEDDNAMPADTVRMARAAYPPVTRINYRAMIGLPGGATLFQELYALGVSYTVLEGETMIYPVPGRLVLHGERDPVARDAAVFRDALTAAGEPGLSLLWVHFHGLDDLNHRWGPADERTRAHLLTLGDYCRRLRRVWPGGMLVVSDHGAHTCAGTAAGTAGGHGDFIFADMGIPLISAPGQGNGPGPPGISPEQAAMLLGAASIFAAGHEQGPAAAPDRAALMVITRADTLRFSAADSALFQERFELSFERKGETVVYRFTGRRFDELLPAGDAGGCERLTARSADGHTAVFTAADPGLRSLIIRYSPEERGDTGPFALYPEGDRFPNRIVKYLTTIICE